MKLQLKKTIEIIVKSASIVGLTVGFLAGAIEIYSFIGDFFFPLSSGDNTTIESMDQNRMDSPKVTDASPPTLTAVQNATHPVHQDEPASSILAIENTQRDDLKEPDCQNEENCQPVDILPLPQTQQVVVDRLKQRIQAGEQNQATVSDETDCQTGEDCGKYNGLTDFSDF